MEENINIQNGENLENTEQANKTVESFDDRPVLINVDHVNMEFVLSNEKVDNLKEFVIRKIKKNYKVNKFILFGDSNKISDKESLIEHLNNHNLKLVDFKNLEIIDYGSIIVQ